LKFADNKDNSFRKAHDAFYSHQPFLLYCFIYLKHDFKTLLQVVQSLVIFMSSLLNRVVFGIVASKNFKQIVMTRALNEISLNKEISTTTF